SAILMAALDGIKHQIDPGEPMDKNLYDLEPEEYVGIDRTPHDLGSALDALDLDHDFLLEGGVFTDDVIRYWTTYKREEEVLALNARPHPYEFCMYYDV
ncbi:MAG: hypothetical protein AAGI54_14785, partial [Planctomycetota bacterium]